MCEPVATAGSAGSVPVQRAKPLPGGVGARFQPGRLAKVPHVAASGEVGFGEQDARHDRRGRLGDGGQFLDLPVQRRRVHLEPPGSASPVFMVRPDIRKKRSSRKTPGPILD